MYIYLADVMCCLNGSEATDHKGFFFHNAKTCSASYATKDHDQYVSIAYSLQQ